MDRALDQLNAHIARLERRIAELEQGHSAPPKAEPEAAPSRRNLFRLAAVGVGAAAGVVATPNTAAAAGPPILADTVNPTEATTSLNHVRSGFHQEGFRVLSHVHDGDPLLFATGALASLNWGVFGMSPNTGVHGETTGTYGVHGRRWTTTSTPAGTAGVYGEHKNTDANGTGVIGRHFGAGWGMWAISASGKGLHADGGTGTGAEGVTTGTVANTYGLVGRVTAANPATGTAAVRAVTASTTGESVAVRAIHGGSGAAVHASASTGTGVLAAGGTGRGGLFSGDTAQISLKPGSLTTHPAPGTRGDLYADKTGRLWFCKKTGNPATWAEIA